MARGLSEEQVLDVTRAPSADQQMTSEEIRSRFIRYRDQLAEADFIAPIYGAGVVEAIIPLETAVGLSDASLLLEAPWVIPDVVMATMAAP